MKSAPRIQTIAGASHLANGSTQSPAPTPSALAAPLATARTLIAIVSTIGFTSAQVGTNYCTPAVPNTVSLPARISAIGSSDLSLNNNRLTLRADDLPPSQFGFFVTSRTQAMVANHMGSQGTLCLGGTLGRYVGAGQVRNSGPSGSFDLLVDLSMTPEGGAFVQVAGGETWSFQAWYRDVGPAGQAGSNFTDGLEVQFTGSSVSPLPGMVPIPLGTFMMGSNASSAAPYHNSPLQQPVHQVTISSPFWMGEHEVTQAEYQALIGVNPSTYVGASRPVEQVDWHQARAYCAALTAQQAANVPAGYEYRLPTEAEWEYACRAGTTTEFHYGAALFCNQARFSYSHYLNPPSSCGAPNSTVPVPVGSYAPNAFGLYDMHGNVTEWCLDSLVPYVSASVTDPFVTTNSLYRVNRGGGWSSDSSGCRSATRSGFRPIEMHSLLGFRVVLGPIRVP